MMQQPHRPGPLHQTNKAHKGGRHNRKSSAASEIKSKLISKPTLKQNRNERLNQALQNRQLKRDRTISEKRKLGCDSQPPILVGVLGSRPEECQTFLGCINDGDNLTTRTINERVQYVIANKLKMRYKLIVLDQGNLDESLDVVKGLDLMILLHRPKDLESEDHLLNSELVRLINIHCLPTIIHVVDGTPKSDAGDMSKDLLKAKRSLKSFLGDEKIHVVEKSQDCLQLFHVLGNCKRQRSLFKEARPMVVTDHAEVIDGNLTFLGYVRMKTLNPNDLVHVVGFGDFQMKKIDILPDVVSIKPLSKEGNQIVETLKPDPMKQESLDQENEIDPMEGEQTWPTAEELAAEAERKNTKKIIRKLPPGTSEYQGAWIPESDEDEGGDDDEDSDGDGDDMAVEPDEDSDGDVGQLEDSENENLEQDEAASVMEVDDYDKNFSNEKELKVLEKLKEARANEMFPDEMDTPFDETARARFARYRGLKSFRTSHWDPQENLPPDYSRIFQFQNFQQTKRRVINDEAQEGANPGQYVRVHLSGVTQAAIDCIIKRQITPNLIGLLKHERKMTVMNLLIKRVQGGNQNHPIKSKDELIFYVGHRKFKARPLFTNHSISSKYKYERFLRDDVAMVATLYAPITFPPAPVLVFREMFGCRKELVATGSVMDSNPNRLAIKRIRLSGHPFKIHSKTAVIRFMFFNSEDVQYFKPVELVTRYNRRGHITEPLGTHGHMKCTFDKKIRSDDCVFMNLYKRVFPKWTYEPIYDAC